MLKVYHWRQQIRGRIEHEEEERERQIELEKQQIECQQRQSEELQRQQERRQLQEQQQQMALIEQQEQHYQLHQLEQPYQHYPFDYLDHEQQTPWQPQQQQQQHLIMKRDYQEPSEQLQYSHGLGMQETCVKIEQRISLLESLETPPPSDLPPHPPPSSSSNSPLSYTDCTATALQSSSNNYTPAISSTSNNISCATTSKLDTLSSGDGSSNQGYQVVCSPPSQKLTLTFPLMLPKSAAADVDIMRRNLWLMIARTEIPRVRKRRMSFKCQKRSKNKLIAQRSVGHIKEFRRRNALKAARIKSS